MNNKFNLGQIVATVGAREELSNADMMKALDRFVRGDWGDLDQEDWDANDEAVVEGERLLGAYYGGENGTTKFWIITEWDRSVTTILLPEEY
jgi:hypothetical protein